MLSAADVPFWRQQQQQQQKHKDDENNNKTNDSGNNSNGQKNKNKTKNNKGGGISKQAIGEGIRRCVQYGYHPVWMWVTDDMWLLAQSFLPALKDAFGPMDVVLDCWAWYVDSQNPGWYPHRDRSSTSAFYPFPHEREVPTQCPVAGGGADEAGDASSSPSSAAAAVASSQKNSNSDASSSMTTTSTSASASTTTTTYHIPGYITCWVPLTDVNPESGCLYCLPADRDIGYRGTGEKSLEDYMVDPRLYRALPSDGCVLFSHRLLHWGSRPSALAKNPRMSLFFAIAQSDFEAPCFDRRKFLYHNSSNSKKNSDDGRKTNDQDRYKLPPIGLRVALVAGHRLIYSTHVPLTEADALTMWHLFMLQKNEGAFHASYVDKVKRSPAYKKFIAPTL